MSAERMVAIVEQMRSLYMRLALEYSSAVRSAMREGAVEEDVEDLAWMARAFAEAAKAENPGARYDALYAERYGREEESSPPRLRLVVDNTREGAVPADACRAYKMGESAP
jgi:hypothetical protein